jgi:hypothetical protein
MLAPEPGYSPYLVRRKPVECVYNIVLEKLEIIA